MNILRKFLLPTTLAVALAAPSVANAELASWYVNYGDAVDVLQNQEGYGSTVNDLSNLTDEYKFTAESIILFDDNDGSGTNTAGDTFDDLIFFTIDQLNYGGVNNGDIDYNNFVGTDDNGAPARSAQISGVLIAEGTQVTDTAYTVDTATIFFFFDSPNIDGTSNDFGDLDTFVDGVLVQVGFGAGVGSNDPLFPNGDINVFFELADTLSEAECDDGEADCGPFEVFDPFADLEDITFKANSDNELCQTAGVCGSDPFELASFFGFDLNDYICEDGELNCSTDFFFHTRSDGSAVKTLVPEPGSLALLGLGLLGLGASRRRKAKS